MQQMLNINIQSHSCMQQILDIQIRFCVCALDIDRSDVSAAAAVVCRDRGGYIARTHSIRPHSSFHTKHLPTKLSGDSRDFSQCGTHLLPLSRRP